jgi:hypothetical protein
MYIPAMVGEVDVSGFNRTNDLLKGEGQIGPLILNTDLVRRPHRRRQSAPPRSLPCVVQGRTCVVQGRTGTC